MRVLRRVAQRVLQEFSEDKSNVQAADLQEERLIGLVHGLPGAGKSRVIWWIRVFFEEALGRRLAPDIVTFNTVILQD